MRTLIWGKTFVRGFKRVIRKQPRLRDSIEETLELLAENPFAPMLATHKLKGQLSDSWACSAGYDLRIIFDFIKSEEQAEDDIFLLEIGTHDDVY
jgi:addiction module RelE/StbE family toxin